MTREKRQAIRKWAARIVGGLVGVLVLYVLSIGPVVRWFTVHGVVSEKQMVLFDRFYGPLQALGPQFEDALAWYIELWMF